MRPPASAAPTRPSPGPAPCCNPAAPSSSTARQQICQGALLVTTVIRTCGIAREQDRDADEKAHDRRTLGHERDLHTPNGIPAYAGFMHRRGKCAVSVRTSTYLQRLQRQSGDPIERSSHKARKAGNEPGTPPNSATRCWTQEDVEYRTRYGRKICPDLLRQGSRSRRWVVARTANSIGAGVAGLYPGQHHRPDDHHTCPLRFMGTPVRNSTGRWRSCGRSASRPL